MKVFYLPKVTKFIKALSNDPKDKILALIEVLVENNGQLSNIDSKSLGKGLFELRLIGGINVRIFYCFHQDSIYLLHAIFKKAQKISKKDLDYAREMQKIVAH